MNRYLSMLPALCIVAAGCTGSSVRQHKPAEVSRVYAFMAKYPEMDAAVRDSAYDADSTTINAFLRTVGAGQADSTAILAWSSSDAVRIFTPDVDSVYGEGSAVAAAAGMVLGNAAGRYSLPRRKYAAVVYGRPESILFVDSVMLIALNHYLGAGYPGYSHIPAYLRLAKTPSALPYDIAEALVGTAYPYENGQDATLLSRMLYEGALAAAKMELVDGSTPAAALGYDEPTYKALLGQEREMWQQLVGQKLIYDTSPALVRHLIMPAPASTVGTLHTPGRVGRFIGYRIVAGYLEDNPGTTVATLLSPRFYNSTDALASYAP